METIIKTEDGVRVSVDSWDDGGAWLHLQGRGASMNAVLTRDEAQRLVDGLQRILDASSVNFNDEDYDQSNVYCEDE
jgi:hypothetical protein